MLQKTVALLLAIATQTAVAAGAEPASTFTAELPGGTEVALQLPSNWNASSQQAGPSTTIDIGPAAEGDFVFLLTVFALPSDSPLSTPEGLRAAVLEIGNSKLHTATQDSIELLEIESEHALGYIYHLTDGSPGEGPGNYREAHQGMLLLQGHVASATVLTHSEDLATVEEAKRVLRTVHTKGPRRDG